MEKVCPCGSTKNLMTCCLPFITGEIPAPTAEALMRSRYTAFALKEMEYILKTTDPQMRHDFDLDANLEWAKTSTFKSLEILKVEELGNKAAIEFKATFQTDDGTVHLHHEFSKFRKQAGTWFFRDGKVMAPPENKTEANPNTPNGNTP